MNSNVAFVLFRSNPTHIRVAKLHTYCASSQIMYKKYKNNTIIFNIYKIRYTDNDRLYYRCICNLNK